MIAQWNNYVELFEMKLMKTLRWLKVISMMQTSVKMSLMRNHMALFPLVFLGRSYLDTPLRQLKLQATAFCVLDCLVWIVSFNFSHHWGYSCHLHWSPSMCLAHSSAVSSFDVSNVLVVSLDRWLDGWKSSCSALLGPWRHGVPGDRYLCTSVGVIGEYWGRGVWRLFGVGARCTWPSLGL